jgi:hypothetical protein
MFSKTKFTLVAAFVLGTASAALAQSGDKLQGSTYLLNPNAPVPLYAQSVPQSPGLIEGRNVGVRMSSSAVQPAQDRLQSFGGY